MTVLRFEGELILGAEAGFTVLVGGRDVITAVRETEFSGKVTVAFADRVLEGDEIWADEWQRGYSEWTPHSPEELTLLGGAGRGHHDLIRELREYEGRKITLWIADEHVNVLE